LALLQAVHLLSHLASQHFPSAQNFEEHSLPELQVAPNAFFAVQVMLAQYVSPTQPASAIQVRLQPALVQTLGVQVSVVAAPHTPPPPQVRADM
jgi:hypothetical protein